ncbi:hypothetical protein LY78DRAFT_664701 [Colletotrichum sublineola]|uniref:Uncharacterized protein n=1 Tax=Colletotrichum sublineola TaxID=1173701 RepID=A0A066XGW6_COLSU|nr:hypothetical protein LY78DRAFT_664701 [Colletotrichum sublineola]KDN64991.1 hypothetical protein CSUB01_12653 [Colletotrichum sublineola]
MKFFAAVSLVSGLFATAASAIDLHLEFAGGCSTGGGGYICRGWNPNTCCSVNAGTYFASGSFRAIPGNWNIQARGHAGPNCGSIREQQDSAGRDYICLGNGPFGGLGYGFNNKKMIRGATLDARDGEKTEECAQPNVLYLADGTQYNYTAIVEAGQATEELVSLIEAGASADDIPSFNVFKLDEKLVL